MIDTVYVERPVASHPRVGGVLARHPEALVPRRTEVDRAAAIEPGQTLLGQVLVILREGQPAGGRLDPEADQAQLGMTLLHPGEGLEPGASQPPEDGGVEQHPIHDSDIEDLGPEDYEDMADEVARRGIRRER